MLDVMNELGASLKVYFEQYHGGLQTLALTLFASFNLVRIVAYVPQIVKAARDSNGASAISYTTWSLFLASHLTTIFYAIVHLGDLVMATIFLGNALACAAIIIIALKNRRRFHLRNGEHS